MTNQHFSEDEVALFDRQGFLLAPKMLDDATLAMIDAECGRLVKMQQAGEEKAVRYYFETSLIDPEKKLLRRIERIAESSPKLMELFRGDAIGGRVGDLFGEPAVLFKDKYNLKLGGGGGYRTHRDGHWWWVDAEGNRQKGWQVYASRFITVYLSLTHSTRENGCIMVAPMDEARAAIGEEYDEITEDQEQKLTFQPVETEPGDVLFFDARLPHGSGPNLSELPRQILYVTYNRAAEGDQRERYYGDKDASASSQTAKAFA